MTTVSSRPPRLKWLSLLGALALGLCATGCGPGNEADAVGVGAECAGDADCPVLVCDEEPCPQLVCLRQFTGGYCGLVGCTAHEQCPLGSACVAHTDGQEYCFRTCLNKDECNVNRSPAVDANCSSSVEYVTDLPDKACVPPSSGD